MRKGKLRRERNVEDGLRDRRNKRLTAEENLRWLTPQGLKLRQELINHIQEETWPLLIKDFPFVQEVENGRDLRGINLQGVNLEGVDLGETDLEGANLERANLGGANLRGANLRGAILNRANLERANLEEANLSEAVFLGANLTKANFRKANLWFACFRGANLECARFEEANLTGADLEGVNLEGANFIGARLMSANLKGADLKGSYLIHSLLVNTNIVDANLSECWVYGSSVWDLKRSKKTLMSSLVISEQGKPIITIDDIEVAQFIYLLLDNKKLRNVIDTMRTKAVLILGSFDPDSKKVIESLKDAIRSYGYLPLCYDFTRPESQDHMETVRTLALLSKFVIVDLSIRSGQLHELARLVDGTFIPFATIARRGTQVTAMLAEFRHYYWFRNEFFPYPAQGWEKEIPELFKNEIIPWAGEINERLMRERQGK